MPGSWAPGWTGGSGCCRASPVLLLALPRCLALGTLVGCGWPGSPGSISVCSWLLMRDCGFPPSFSSIFDDTRSHTCTPQEDCLCICAFLCASETFPVVIGCRVASFSLIHIVVLCFLGYSIDMCTLNTSKRIVIAVIKPRFLSGVLLWCGKPYLLHGHSLFWSH